MTMPDASRPTESVAVSVPAEPADAPAPATVDPAATKLRLDPTRYGDWEKNGRCIDF